MIAPLLVIVLLISACTTQPVKKPVNVWLEQVPDVKKVYEIAWFDGDWRLCEVGHNCPKVTPKSPLQMISLAAIQISTPARPDSPENTPRTDRTIVHFESGHSDPQDLAELETLLGSIEEGEGLRITGYTDSVGDKVHNQKLAWQRAKKVSAWLKQRGVRNPVEIVTRGACCYLAANDTEQGRAHNRRVEIEIIDEEKSQ